MVDEKEIYKLISETIHDGLLELDLRGRIIQANPAALSMLGYTLDEIIQKTHRDLTPAKWHQQESQAIQEAALVQHNAPNIEQEYVRKNGSIFPVALTPMLLADANKTQTKILILCRDLTSQKEQEQLQQAHLRQLNSLSLITRKLQDNDSIEYTIHFVLEALVAAMTYPQLAVPLIAIEDETFSTDKYSDDLEYGLTAPLYINGHEAGELTMYYTENKPFKQPDEQNILEAVASTLGVWLSLKSANQELVDYEEQYRSVFDAMTDGFALYEVKDEGQEMIVADWNRAAEKMYNLLRQEVLGQDIKKFFPAMEKTEVYKAIVECSQSGESKIIPLVHYQDAQHDQYMHNVIYPVGDKVAAIFRDVTEEEKARQRLVQSEQKSRSLIEGSSEAIYLLTLDPVNPQFIDINQSACQMLHYTRTELLTLGPTKIDSPQNAALVPERMAKILKEGKALFESEHMTKEGQLIPVEINSSIVELAGEKFILSFARDITERKKIENVLHESEAKFRNLSDLAPVGIFFLNMQGEVVYVNKKLISFSGMTFDECLGQGWRKLIHPEEQEEALNIITGPLPQGKEESLKFRILNKQNETRWVHTQIKMIVSAQNQPTGFIGIVEDVTDIEKAKTAMTNQLAFIQQLLEAIPNPVFYKDAQGIYQGCNQAFERFLGRAKEKIIGKSVYELAPKDLADVYHQKDEELLSHPGTQAYESSIQQADGTRRLVIFNKATYNNPDGTIAGLIGVVTDITECQKQEQKYKAIIETSIDGFWLTDMQGNIIEVNDSYCKMIGYSRVELQKMKIADLEVNEKPAEIQARIHKIMENGSDRFETKHKCKDGTIIDIVISVTILRDSDQMFVFSHDISERKKAEVALQQNEDQLSNALNIAHLGPWEYDVVKDIFTFTDSFYTVFHTTAEQVGGYTMSAADYVKRFVHPEDAAVVGEETRKAIETTDSNFSRQLEHRKIDANGEIGYISVRFFIVKDQQGKTIKTYGVNQDITERKKYEETLLQQQQELSTILDSTPAMIFYKDKNNNFIRVNKAMAKSMGLTKEQLEGKSVFDIYPKEEAEKYWQDDKAVMDSGQPRLNIVESMQTQEGLKWVQTDKIPYRNEKGEIIGIVGFAVDITERRQAEAALRVSEAQLLNAAYMARLGPWEYDVVNDVFTFTDSFYAIFHTTAEQAGGYTMSSADYVKRFVHPEDAEVVSLETRRAIEATDSNFSHQLEHRIIDSHGEVGYISVRYFIIKDQQGRTVNTYGVNQDITERKRAEEELKKRINELDRFNKVTMEREKRIIELKKKLKDLEQNAHGQ